MVEQGLSVPPGLKRGGYTRISTGRSIPTGPSLLPSSRASDIPVLAHEDPPKPHPAREKNMASKTTDSDDSGSDSDERCVPSYESVCFPTPLDDCLLTQI